MPFYATAIGALVADDAHLAGQLVHAQLAYGAVIASFLGAVHWGLAMAADRPMSGRLIAGILPSLAGWALVVLDAVRPMSPVTTILSVCPVRRALRV